VSRITKLEAENVKRLRAVTIEPNGNVIVIGGKNAQGKSSVLDSILVGIQGKKVFPSMPVRKGEESAKATITLDNGLVVTRKIKPDGTQSVVITTRDNAVCKSPQDVLNKLLGANGIGFDPLDFVRQEGKKQLATLKSLVGLDFSEMDAERDQLYTQRTTVNSEGSRLKAQFDAIPAISGLPDTLILATELIIERDRLQGVIDNNKLERDKLRMLLREYEIKGSVISQMDTDIGALKERLAKMEARRADEVEQKATLHNTIADQKAVVDALEDPTFTEIDRQISSAEDTNQKIRSQIEKDRLAKMLEVKRKENKDLSEKIKTIDAGKMASLSATAFPVPGLSFGESEVLYNDIPLAQCSSAEQLRVSCAMGIAMNPELKVLLIRDGSLLDEDNLKMLADMAEAADAQVWIERVGEGKEVSVIIEDGAVKE
jgi:hypothetical protein